MLNVHIKRTIGRPGVPAQQLLEVVTPRTNAALISPAEHLCGSLTLQTRGPGGGPVALEIVADGERSRFLVRTASELQQRQLRGQVGAAYPQAALRRLEWATLPSGDPVQIGPHEQILGYTMALRVGDHLPIRTFQDRELGARLPAPCPRASDTSGTCRTRRRGRVAVQPCDDRGAGRGRCRGTERVVRMATRRLGHGRPDGRQPLDRCRAWIGC